MSQYLISDVAGATEGMAQSTGSDTAWQGLHSPKAEEFSSAWLQLLGGEVGPCDAFVVRVEGDTSELEMIASIGEADLERYREILDAARAAQQAELYQVGSPTKHEVMVYPVISAGQLRAMVLVVLAGFSSERVAMAMQKLQWGIGQLESFFQHRDLTLLTVRVDRVADSLELILATLEQPNLVNAGRALTTELAIKLGATRVSIGIVEGGTVTILAMSHAARFAEEANLVRAVAAAMEEAIDQHNAVLVPDLDGCDAAPVKIANRELRELSGANSLCTLPFFLEDEFAGAVLLEFVDPQTLDHNILTVAEAVTGVLAPSLHLHYLNERGLLTRCRFGFNRLFERLVGPGHLLFKAITLIAVGIGLFLSLVGGQFRITADAVLEGRVQRAAVAPFEGYIADAFHRAGDFVKAGTVLAKLDDREIILELNKWRAKQQQISRRYREARAEENSAELRIYQAQLGEAKAEIALLEQNLVKTEIKAPLAGFVVSGDLSQSLGAPTARGDVLFELAPPEDFRVVVKVDERDVRFIEIGQSGNLALKSVPNTPLAFEVVNITPVSQAEEGINAFEVEASLSSPQISLLPGMEGVAKVDAGTRKYGFILSRRFMQWFDIWTWSWLP